MAVQLKKQQTAQIKKEEVTPKKSMDAGTVKIKITPEISEEELNEFTLKVLQSIKADLRENCPREESPKFTPIYFPPIEIENESGLAYLTQFQRIILAIVLSGLGFFLLLAVFGTGWQDARSAVYYSAFDAFTVCLQVWILHLGLFWVFYDLLRDFSE